MVDRLTQHIADCKTSGVPPGTIWEAIDQRFLALGSALAVLEARLSEVENRKSPSPPPYDPYPSATPTDPLVGLLEDIRDDIRTLCILQQQANAKQKRRR
jgi:hypothetical protein